MPPRRAKTVPGASALVTRRPGRISKTTLARRTIHAAVAPHGVENARSIDNRDTSPDNRDTSPDNTEPDVAGILQAGFTNLQTSLETMHSSFQDGFGDLAAQIRLSAVDSFGQPTDYIDNSIGTTHPIPGPSHQASFTPTAGQVWRPQRPFQVRLSRSLRPLPTMFSLDGHGLSTP